MNEQTPKNTAVEERVDMPEILRPQPTAGALTVMPAGHIQPSNEWERQLDLIRKTYAPGLNDDEFAVFTHVARVRRLDPLQRQVHAVKRRTWNSDKGEYDEKMTIQTGIDGYRAIANRTGLYMPSEKEPEVLDAGTANLRIKFYVLKWSDKDLRYHEYNATAWYREYVQTRFDKDSKKQVPVAMWQKMPVNQLTKCAEALALRKGWPEDLGGIYVNEEVEHLNSSVEVIPPTNGNDKKQDKSKRDVGTLERGREQNRGHGNEATHGSAQGSVNTTSGEPKQSQTTETRTSKPTTRGVVTVTKVDPKLKKPSKKQIDDAKAKKQNPPEDKPYFILTCRDAEQHEVAVFVWHASLHKHVVKMTNKECDIEVSQQQTETKTFYALEHIHRINGTKFVDDEPAVEGGITKDDFDQPTPQESKSVAPSADEMGFGPGIRMRG